jgi:tRNA modification GTPase
MIFENTIAAIATPRGSGGVAVIRVSGGDAVSICEKVLAGKKDLKDCASYFMNYGRAVDESGGTVDRVLYVVMRAPHSFTGEDVVEIHAHGGIVNVEKILSLVLRAGAAMAGRGEFTKRAFLNGKLDLAQAEAVADIINSKTELALYGAVNQLEGKLSADINEIRNTLVSLAAEIGVSADYPEEDIDFAAKNQILEKLSGIYNKINSLTKSAQKGKIIREGVSCAIIGRPNTGKSSLLNALLGERRAIVTNEEGTTRDIVEEYVDMDGVAVKLGDTAGLRTAMGEAEEIGINMAREYAMKSDLCILVVDGTNITSEDEEILSFIKDKKHLIAINKSDIMKAKFKNYNGINISAKTGEGIPVLMRETAKLALGGEDTKPCREMITNLRHLEAAYRGEKSVLNAVETINSGFPADLALSDIENAIFSFGEITGQSVSEEIVEKIFSEFCLGK